MKKLITFFLILLTSTFLIACSGNNTDDSPIFMTGAVFLPEAITLDTSDGEIDFPVDTDGDLEAIEWSSSNPTVATIDETGTITILKQGIITITATSGEHSDSSTLYATYDKYTDYIRIETKAQFLMTFSNPDNFNDPTKKYVLTEDIDFNGDQIEPIGGWDRSDLNTPVDPNTVFRATLDGRGYALKNFVIDDPLSTKVDRSYFGVALFPFIDGGIVRNLNLINITINGNGFSGGIAGKITNGLIENCFVQGTITATDGRSGMPGGGIAGIVGPDAMIQNVFLDVYLSGAHIYAGFNFGTGTNSMVVSQTLDDSERRVPVSNTAITTGKGDADEDAALHQFFDVARLENDQLRSIDNYPFSTSAKRDFWIKLDGYMPYLVRPDGQTPDWATLPEEVN